MEVGGFAGGQMSSHAGVQELQSRAGGQGVGGLAFKRMDIGHWPVGAPGDMMWNCKIKTRWQQERTGQGRQVSSHAGGQG